MKKARRKTKNNDEMRDEYDFTGGVRGKHYKAMQSGYSIRIHHEDGTTTVKDFIPRKGVIILDSDIQPYFPDSESVNTILRTLIRLAPAKNEASGRKQRGIDT